MSAEQSSNAILARWSAICRSRATAPAIFDCSGRVLRKFEEIEEEARIFQAKLAEIPPGTVVGIQLGNSPAWPAVLLACFYARMIPLPFGEHMGALETESALAAAGAGLVTELRNGEPILKVCKQQNPSPPFPDPAPEFLKLTSGTTNVPRVIRFRSAQLVADCDQVCDTMGIRETDRNFGVIPFSHSYGFSNLITPLLCRGVALVTSNERMPRAILEGLEQSGATVFPGMPVFYQALCGLEPKSALGRLRLCISAGAPLPPALGAHFTRQFGLKIHTFYGSSECGGISYDRSDEAEYEEGFVGAPMERVEISPLTRTGPSQISVRSAAVGDGYWPEPDLDTLGGGAFVPGDLVRSDKRGLYLAGRLSDVINVAGRKLHPGEVEARMALLPGVREVVVFGVPSSLRNEEPIACVSVNGPVDAATLLQGARALLSAWQVPKEVWVVDEIPVNERGKVSRRELARQYRAR